MEEHTRHKPYGPYERFFKRPLDFLFALVAIILLSPILLVTAVLVRMKLGKPVIFQQNRPGKDGRIFKLYKFRSMTDARDDKGNLLPDEQRLPAFGKRLRSTSLDELPELVNILKGDMAIVGPRPLLVKYLDGRNSISWDEKFDWDVKYVDHITFLGDWKIILETIRVVVKHEGISAAGEATMPEFMGKQ